MLYLLSKEYNKVLKLTLDKKRILSVYH